MAAADFLLRARLSADLLGPDEAAAAAAPGALASVGDCGETGEAELMAAANG